MANETLNIQNGVSPITIDTEVTEGSMRPVTSDGIYKAIQAGGGGGGADVMTVIATETLTAGTVSYTFDRTATETEAAINAGKNVQLLVQRADGRWNSTIRSNYYFICISDTPIADLDASLATRFWTNASEWSYDFTKNFIIPSIPYSTEGVDHPLVFVGSQVEIGDWNYSTNISSLIGDYITNIEVLALAAQDNQAYLTTTIPNNISPYDDLVWIINKLATVATIAQGTFLTVRAVDNAKAYVTFVTNNQFTLSFTDVSPVSGTADVYDITINFYKLSSPDVVSVTIGARHYTSTAHTPS